MGVQELVNVLALRPPLIAATSSVHALKQLDRDDFDQQVDVGHQHLEEVGLVDLIAHILEPVWREVRITSIEKAEEHLRLMLLYKVHMNDKDDDTSVEKLTHEHCLNNGARLIRSRCVLYPLNQRETYR